MIVKIPETGKFYQTNKGDVSGNIWASWNLDLTSNPGRIRVSPQTDVVMSNNTGFTGYDADFGLPLSYFISDADGSMRIWCNAGGTLFNTARGSINPSLTWTKDANTGSPTAEGDIVEFNGALIAATTTSLSRLATPATWTSNWNSITLDSADKHPLCVSFNNLLLIGNGHLITSVDVSDNIDTTAITLPVEYEIYWIRSSNSMIFIGTRNKKGGRAKIFTWDGYSENFNGDYKINGSYSIAGVVKDEICYSINEVGELLAFNGGNFIQVAVFPNFGGETNFTKTTARNCMAVKNDNIYILVSNYVDGLYNNTVNERLRGGLWCYNKKNGLHHAFSISKSVNANVVDYGSPVIFAVGAVMVFPDTYNLILAGASVSVDSANSASHVSVLTPRLESDTDSKIGYFITPKIETKNVEEMWQKIYVLVKKFLYSTDKIVIKYRTDKDVVLEDWAEGTWASTTSFTTSTALTTGDLSLIEAGDEVEILEGEGSGLSSKIMSVSNLSGTYTITISDTVSNASGENRFVVWNWTDVGEDIATQGIRYFERGIGANSSWIQFKVVMFFKGKNELEQFILKSEPQIKL